MQETPVQFLGPEDPLGKGQATHSSVLGIQDTPVRFPGSGRSVVGRIGYPLQCSWNAGDPSSIPGSGSSPGKEIGYPLQCSWVSVVAQLVKNLPARWETWIRSLGWEDSPGEGKGHPLQYSGLENPHGQRTLAGYHPWGHRESDMAKHSTHILH